MPSADWYFDFVSPFSYLQCEQLPTLERSIRIRYRPVLFAALLAAHGHKGPAEIASKRRFTYRFVVWQAAKLGIALKFPAAHPFNPLALLRLAGRFICDFLGRRPASRVARALDAKEPLAMASPA